MPLETGTYISDLVSSNPAGTDSIAQADDHIRLIKSTLLNTFPDVAGAVTLTHSEINDSALKSVENTFTQNQIISVTDNVNAALRVTQAGTAAAIRVEDSSTPDSTPFIVTAAGDVGVGASIPASKFHIIGGNGDQARLDNTGSQYTKLIFANNNTETANITWDHTNSEFVTELAASNKFVWKSGGNERMRIGGGGNVGIGTSSPDGALDVVGASGTSQFKAGTDANGYFTVTAYDSNPVYCLVAGSNATAAVFGSQTNIPYVFSQNNVEAARIDTSKNLLLTSTGGLGYGTGSGGTVTQITSRTTGVTINKTNGQITMFSAAGSTTAASFTVTNSTVAATDTVIVCQASGTNKYNINVTAVSAGSFEITFRTFSGTATDAPVLNFSVIKAVTS